MTCGQGHLNGMQAARLHFLIWCKCDLGWVTPRCLCARPAILSKSVMSGLAPTNHQGGQTLYFLPNPVDPEHRLLTTIHCLLNAVSYF